MTDKPNKSDEAQHAIYLRSHDQKTLAAVAGLLFVVGAVCVGWFSFKNGGITHIDDLPERQAAFQVDLNQADWTEISALPKIGPAVAKAIVAYRQQNGRFASQQDLLQVPGVGKYTLRQMEPYLNGLPKGIEVNNAEVDGEQRVASRSEE